jgi:shikimate dehydrogenase
LKSTSSPVNITGSTQIIFIFGHPVEHSLSPIFQNAALRKMKIPCVYVPLDVAPQRMKSTIETLRNENVQGANVTVPLKTLVLAHLDQVDPAARNLNSVNTIYKKREKLHGASTDGEGFLRSLGKWRNGLRGSNGMLVGAGGAARSIAYALARSGVKSLKIANWDAREAHSLWDALHREFPKFQTGCMNLKEGESSMENCDWIIQATSLGLKEGDPSPLSIKKASSLSWVVDLIYHRQTDFLKEAEKLKVPFINGLGMLLHQGALSFELWTGRKAPVAEMRKALLHSLGS